MEIQFFGNSITESGKDWGAKLGIDNAKNRNISADVVDGYLSRLGELIKFKPVSIFIIIGINGLFKLHYQKGISSPSFSYKKIS